MATMPPTDSLHASNNSNESTINTGYGSAIQQQPSIVPFDAENPYYLHSSDGTGTTLVGNVLTGIDNYNPWARAMTMALKGRNKFCFVDGSLPMPDVAHPDHASWHRVNNMVMSWILNSIHSSLANTVLYSTDAASAWTDLQERFSTANGPRIYEIEKRISTFSQRDASIADYHNHLSALWDELNQLVPPPKYESQRVQSEGHEHPVDHSALQAARIGIDAPAPLQSHISSMPQFTAAAANQSSTNRAHASSSTSRPSNHRPRLRCAHCGILGHTQQVCYKLHGYPPGHKFYKKGNTNSQPITAQSTSPIPSESLQQLIQLLQEVKEPKANLVETSSPESNHSTPNSPIHAQSCSNSPPPTSLRRSQRQHKPPSYLSSCIQS
nr:UBN2_3 domain-containing protein [Ipomoea batatas]